MKILLDHGVAHCDTAQGSRAGAPKQTNTFRELAPLSATLLFMCLPALGAEYACPAIAPDTAGKPKYQRLDGPPRCEGYFTRKVSQKFVELISLTAGNPPSMSGDAATLPLRVPLLATAAKPADLLIQPLGAHPLYRVDLPIGREPIAWSAKPMLDSTGLELRRIGFLATVGESRPGELAVTPISFSDNVAESGLTATVRVSVEVVALRYRVVARDGSAASKTWQDVPRMPLYAWDTTKLNLPSPSSSDSYRVEVEATDDQKHRLPLLRFSIAGSDGK